MKINILAFVLSVGPAVAANGSSNMRGKTAFERMLQGEADLGVTCESNTVCAALGLEGACCPTNDGVYLDCCNRSCQAHAACDDLATPCCPTVDGVDLECCDHTDELEGIPPESGNRNPCPTDVKTCPDGSVVVRVGEECVFQACPTAGGACPADIQYCPDGSVVVREGKECKFQSCEKDVCTRDVAPCAKGEPVGRVPPSCNFELCEDGTCPTDTRECSDGSQVFRVLPSCEHEECPRGSCLTDTLTCHDGSKVTRVPPSCDFAPCPTSTKCAAYPSCSHLVEECCPTKDGVFLACCSPEPFEMLNTNNLRSP